MLISIQNSNEDFLNILYYNLNILILMIRFLIRYLFFSSSYLLIDLSISNNSNLTIFHQKLVIQKLEKNILRILIQKLKLLTSDFFIELVSASKYSVNALFLLTSLFSMISSHRFWLNIFIKFHLKLAHPALPQFLSISSDSWSSKDLLFSYCKT